MQLGTFTGAAWDIDAAGGTGKIWRIYGGCTYPLLRGFLKPLSATAANDTQPYTGVGYSGGNGVAFSPADYDASKVFGTGTYGGSSQGAIAPGTYAITPGAWSNQQGYDITAVSGTLTINAGPGLGRVPDGITGAPLQVCRNLSQLDLTWGASCGAAATDYAVYEGTIGSWTSHTPLVCTTADALSADGDPFHGNHYYFIVPLSPLGDAGRELRDRTRRARRSRNPPAPAKPPRTSRRASEGIEPGSQEKRESAGQ